MKVTKADGSEEVVVVMRVVTAIAKQTTRFWCILFLSIPQNLPVSIPESGHSAGMKKIAGLPAKFYSTRMTGFRQIPAGIRGH
jgi:hypothetical protein